PGPSRGVACGCRRPVYCSPGFEAGRGWAQARCLPPWRFRSLSSPQPRPGSPRPGAPAPVALTRPARGVKRRAGGNLARGGAMPEPTGDFAPKAADTPGHARTRTLPPAAAPPELADDGPPAPPPVPGYEVERELGRGGMGVVYLARQTAVNRTVALKMVLAGGRAAPAELVRFLGEAEAA